MSKLAQELRRVRHGAARLGFVAERTRPDHALLLITALGRCDPALVASAAQSNAGAVLVPWAPSAELDEAVRAAAGRPLGVRLLGAVEAGAVEACRQAGGDFVLCDPHAQAGVLGERQLGVVMGVAYSWEDSLLRVIGDLPIEALEGEPITAASPPLRIRDLLRLRRVLALSGRPLIVPTERALSRAELEVLVESGIDAVEIAASLAGDTPAAVAATVSQWSEAVAALPARELRRRRERVAATLPFPGQRTVAFEEEEEDEDH